MKTASRIIKGAGTTSEQYIQENSQRERASSKREQSGLASRAHERTGFKSEQIGKENIAEKRAGWRREHGSPASRS
jgi:hypothetical protein